MLFSSERIFLTLAVRILVSTRFCWRISRLMLRKVFAVDDSANEAQVLWQKLPGIVHDKDAFYVQLYSDLVFSLVQVKRSFRRHVEQRGVVQCSLRPGVKPEQRILRIAGDGFIEFFVILFRELALGTTPKSTGHVEPTLKIASVRKSYRQNLHTPIGSARWENWSPPSRTNSHSPSRPQPIMPRHLCDGFSATRPI